MRGGGDGLPLLRGVTAQTLAGIAGEEQVLVFAERVRCLRQLAATLRERHGVEAHVADGSITGREFEALKQRFTAGEFPILCLSRVGHEGHNLQNASRALPPRPAVAARRARAARRPRRPARAPCAAGCRPTSPTSATPASRTSSRSSRPRGGEHHQVLDSYEGVAAADSTVATQLGQITGEIAEHKDARRLRRDRREAARGGQRVRNCLGHPLSRAAAGRLSIVPQHHDAALPAAPSERRPGQGASTNNTVGAQRTVASARPTESSLEAA